MNARIRVCAVLTAFNRRWKTLSSLRAFFEQRYNCDLRAVLMDDGSTDGTAESVQREFDNVTILKGDGTLFWNRGMAAAYKAAHILGADYYLWLNDDTNLYPDALGKLISDADSLLNPSGCIIVGSTLDPETRLLTYGGVRACSKWHTGRFIWVEPRDQVQPCDTMNGNVVLISATAAQTIGPIDEHFSHSMGDLDYGFRANGTGVTLVVGRGFHGECQRNPLNNIWYHLGTVRERCKRVNSPTGLPMKEWAYFLRKHGHANWPLVWLVTYRRIITG